MQLNQPKCPFHTTPKLSQLKLIKELHYNWYKKEFHKVALRFKNYVQSVTIYYKYSKFTVQARDFRSSEWMWQGMSILGPK